MIKAIIFDLGGVLFTDGATKFKRYLSDKYDVPYNKVNEVISATVGSDYRSGKISRDEFWDKALDVLRINTDINKLEEKWINGYQLIHETKNLILLLKKKYKVYFLSDNIKERVERLNNLHGFIEWFEDGIFSHETGMRKPDPEIYKLILKKIKIKPEEGVFIDDNPKNLIPANNLGLKTFLFENSEKLKREFKIADIL